VFHRDDEPIKDFRQIFKGYGSMTIEKQEEQPETKFFF